MRGTAALALAGALAATVAAAGDRRELGAHEHGHSTLTIAVEGTRVAMELATPGAAIAASRISPPMPLIAQSLANLAPPDVPRS